VRFFAEVAPEEEPPVIPSEPQPGTRVAGA
jgi:hypothetical protein